MVRQSAAPCYLLLTVLRVRRNVEGAVLIMFETKTLVWEAGKRP
jgi:hypothetical protein